MARQSTLDPDRTQHIRHWMQRYVNQRKYAGSSLLLIQGGKKVFFHTCGHRDLARKLPFARDTVVRIYSMTKPITSVAIMILVERGLFPLNALVSDFLPEFADMQALVSDATRIDQTEPAMTPTVHQLLTHTSGLSYSFNPGILPEAMEAQELFFKPDQGLLADNVTKIATLPLAFQPGTRWEYSVATDVLGRIVEIVSGQSLDGFLLQNVFEPLGMTKTGFSVPHGASSRFASLYTPLAGDAMALNSADVGENSLRLVDEAGKSPFERATMYSGGGGLVSTIDDYARFAEMLRNRGQGNGHRLLGTKTVEFMMLNHLPGDIASMGPRSFAEQPMEGMGFGLAGAVVIRPGRTRVAGSQGDFSWGGMASTFFWIDYQNDLTSVFFTQLSPSSSYPSRAELKSLVLGTIIE